MTKKIIGIIVGCIFIALATWKGPHVASVVAAALGALLLVLSALHIIPARFQAYADDVEAALEEADPDKAKALATKHGVNEP